MNMPGLVIFIGLILGILPDSFFPGNEKAVNLPDTMETSLPVNDSITHLDTLQIQNPAVPLIIQMPFAYDTVTNDSLIRWELWSDYGEWRARQRGVIAYRLGGFGRNDGFLIRAHENRHQRIYRDGIPMNERIFGSVNRNRLPHYSRVGSVHEFSAPIRFRSEINTRRYYVTRPLTFINYEQTAFDYRSAEGFLTRNITLATNLSIAYWGKNENEGYRNNSMGGRNIAVSMYHFPNNSWMIEGGFYYSGLQLGEPHGYQISDMFTFAFNRFEVFPMESFAESSMRNAIIQLTAYYRRHPDQQARTRTGIYHDRYRRLHYDETDSSFVRTLTTGVFGRHIQMLGPIEVQGEFYSEWSVIDRNRYLSMMVDSWVFTRGQSQLTLPLSSRSKLYGWMEASWRTDGFTDYEIGSKADWRIFNGWSLYGSYARGEMMPQPGHLYWHRLPVYGNSKLKNEIIQRAEAG
ncbi:MAG: hypothetical protein WD097_06765, partial [Balneolales bacterium]